MRQTREGSNARTRKHRHHADHGRQEHARTGFAQTDVLGAFDEHIDDADVLKTRCKESRHEDKTHSTRENAAHALEHRKAQIKRLLGVATNNQIHEEGKHPGNEHCRGHIERDALIHHLVEDEQQHDRDDRKHRINRGNVFKHLALFFEFLQVSCFAFDVVVLVKPILNHHVSDSHRKNRGNGHRQLVLHQILDGIEMNEFGCHHGHTGSGRITDGKYACNNRSRRQT